MLLRDHYITYYISLSRLLAIHVSHQLSKLWRVCTAVLFEGRQRL